jgi:7,8-dihydropterin-6-yl-methyl-4-(beta-D-ribofuranosyl)aminobenzene 5'-phosphate synthase
MKGTIDRRGFLRSATATGSLLVCYGVLDATAHAAPVRITPPVVDRLTIQVVLDSNHDVFISGAQSPGVGVKRVRLPAAFNGRTLESEWGLSLYLTSTKGTETRRILLDFGYTPDVLNNNLELLGIDVAAIDALVLSHGHQDHFGGMLGFLAKHRDSMTQDLRLYAGGEDAFCHRVQRQDDGTFLPSGVVDRRALKQARVTPVLSETPIIIEGHAFTTGIVPRTSIERVLPNTFVVFGEQNGVGCNTSSYGDHHFTAEELAGVPVPDQHWHEHATCYQVGDRGLVVITSCGHGGILNTLRRAQEVTGVEKVYALCGGFHLAPAQQPYLDQIMAELKKLDIDHVIPMHCSGSNFLETAKREMPEKLVLCTTGSQFSFAA